MGAVAGSGVGVVLPQPPIDESLLDKFSYSEMKMISAINFPCSNTDVFFESFVKSLKVLKLWHVHDHTALKCSARIRIPFELVSRGRWAKRLL